MASLAKEAALEQGHRINAAFKLSLEIGDNRHGHGFEI